MISLPFIAGCVFGSALTYCALMLWLAFSDSKIENDITEYGVDELMFIRSIERDLYT